MYLTVIVPVHNGEETLERCLTALVNQNEVTLWQDYEVLVVDDGSTDRTPEIASEFPVRTLRLETNKGRIIARLAGAKEASTENLLFVDSRVILDEHAIVNIRKLQYSPLMAGDLKERENKYKSIFHTIFFLIRRRVYGKKLFPQKSDEFWITKSNFHRAPKGTTVLYITRSLFLKIIPERTDKDVNDDTLLFHNMVFREGVALLRHTLIKAEYLQRSESAKLVEWLYWRGTRFSDYYLRPGSKFFNLFILGIVFITGVIVTLAIFPVAFLPAICTALVIYVSGMIYLSENVRDFFVLFFLVPFIVFVFSLGIARFWIKSFFSTFRRSVRA